MTIKKGDNRNAISASLTKNGQPIDLTDASVLISIQGKVYEDYCQVIGDKVVYPLEKTITDKSGFLKYEFIVRYPDGREETFPNDEYLKLRIMEEVK